MSIVSHFLNLIFQFFVPSQCWRSAVPKKLPRVPHCRAYSFRGSLPHLLSSCRLPSRLRWGITCAYDKRDTTKCKCIIESAMRHSRRYNTVTQVGELVDQEQLKGMSHWYILTLKRHSRQVFTRTRLTIASKRITFSNSLEANHFLYKGRRKKRNPTWFHLCKNCRCDV